MLTIVMTQPWLWKRGNTGAVDTYVGPKGEPLLDMRGDVPLLRIQDGVTPGGKILDAGIIAGIGSPAIVLPVNGTGNIVASPLITSDYFSAITEDVTADVHLASYWEISTDFNFTTTVYSSGRDTANLITLNLLDENVVLDHGINYFVRVRHEGQAQGLSEWGIVSQFSTEQAWNYLEMEKLHASDAVTSDRFGISCTLNADATIALIGAHGVNSNIGVVYVFTRVGSVWSQQQILSASDGTIGDYFGISCTLNADASIALIGAHVINTNGIIDSGSVYVFTRVGSVWTEQQKLYASDASASDQFGVSCTLNADASIALIGAHGNNANGINDSGTVYVFTRTGSVWTEQQKLTASDGAIGDYFGISCALNADATIALIGAHGDDVNGLINPGSAYVFTRSGNTWTQQQKLTAPNADNHEYFGVSCALNADATIALIGAHAADGNGIVDSGVVYVFTRVGSVWTQQQKLTAGDPDVSDQFGRYIALNANGSVALIGAPMCDANGILDSGSVYVFN